MSRLLVDIARHLTLYPLGKHHFILLPCKSRNTTLSIMLSSIYNLVRRSRDSSSTDQEASSRRSTHARHPPASRTYSSSSSTSSGSTEFQSLADPEEQSDSPAPKSTRAESRGKERAESHRRRQHRHSDEEEDEQFLDARLIIGSSVALSSSSRHSGRSRERRRTSRREHTAHNSKQSVQSARSRRDSHQSTEVYRRGNRERERGQAPGRASRRTRSARSSSRSVYYDSIDIADAGQGYDVKRRFPNDLGATALVERLSESITSEQEPFVLEEEKQTFSAANNFLRLPFEEIGISFDEQTYLGRRSIGVLSSFKNTMAGRMGVLYPQYETSPPEGSGPSRKSSLNVFAALTGCAVTMDMEKFGDFSIGIVLPPRDRRCIAEEETADAELVYIGEAW